MKLYTEQYFQRQNSKNEWKGAMLLQHISPYISPHYTSLYQPYWGCSVHPITGKDCDDHLHRYSSAPVPKS